MSKSNPDIKIGFHIGTEIFVGKVVHVGWDKEHLSTWKIDKIYRIEYDQTEIVRPETIWVSCDVKEFDKERMMK